MYERILSEDPVTGKRTIFRADADGENFTLHTTMDVEPILDGNAAIMSQQERFGGRIFDPKKFMHHIARIPAPMFFDLKRRGVISADGTEIIDDVKFAKFLNDNEWCKLRTHKGKV